MEVISPGDKIEVIESVKQYKPHSVGYLAFQTFINPFNLWSTWIVFTRFGSRGRDRIEPIEIRIEMVDMDKITEIGAQDKELVEVMAINLDLLPQSPELRSNAEIKRVPMESKNVANLELWDFLGYISSLSMFISFLAYGHEEHRRRLTRRDWDTIAISDIDPKMLGYHICHAVRQNNGVPIREMYLDYFRNPHNRIGWMYKLYREMSSLRQRVHNYSENKKTAYLNTRQRIIEAADHRTNVKCKGKLQETAPENKLKSVRIGDIDIVQGDVEGSLVSIDTRQRDADTRQRDADIGRSRY